MLKGKPHNPRNPLFENTMSRSFLFPLTCILLMSCTGGTVFHHYKPLPSEGWERHDTVCFDLPEFGEDIDGRLFIGLRTVAHVGMQEVVLAVEQCSDSAGILRRDTVRYPLTDAEGYALTGGVNSHQYENQQLPILLRKGKSTTIRIHHLMTHELIPGITEVGIRISSGSNRERARRKHSSPTPNS